MGKWIPLDAEATQEYLDGHLVPLDVRETLEGVEAWMPHTFSPGPGSDKRCWDCGLLPLDYDAIEAPCEGER